MTIGKTINVLIILIFVGMIGFLFTGELIWGAKDPTCATATMKFGC